jgi:ESCRT-II complex subunit VPS25
MVVSKQAEWLGGKKRKDTPESLRCLLFWRKPAEWADLIYSHVKVTGQTGTIVTVYELFQSDNVSNCEFYQLPEAMWRRAIRVLEDTGKAKLFDSEDGGNSMELGIKFF